ncbi:MAG: aminotransferase class IV [Bryobacteraceae bacterium]
MLHRYILHNDGIREASEPTLRAGQVGLLAGWGVFSTIKVARGVLFAYERHWARMERDAAAFHIPLPGSREEIRERLLRLVAANQAFNSTMRVVFVRNQGGMWQGPNGGRATDLIALTADSKDWGEGVKLCYTPQARHSQCNFAGTKILSWAMNLTWLEDAQARGCDETILLNERGEVAECTSANLFIARGGEVLTPPLSSGCLPGVTREILLSEIRVPGYAIRERTLAPADLEEADDVFITSTTRDLLPVLEIEGRRIVPRGDARRTLGSAFADYVRRYLA